MHKKKDKNKKQRPFIGRPVRFDKATRYNRKKQKELDRKVTSEGE